MNRGGQWVVAGTQGSYLGQGTQGVKLTVPPQDDWDSGVSAGINTSGQWVVAGTQGSFVGQGTEWKKLSIPNQDDWDSGVAADINDGGQWIVAGTQGAYIGTDATGQKIRIKTIGIPAWAWRSTTRASGWWPERRARI